MNNAPETIGLLYVGSNTATGTIRNVKLECGHIYESVVTEPTTEAQGYTTQTCGVCGHSYVDSYVDATGHSYGEWYTETEGTCTTDGQKRRDCANCDHYETEVIGATGHEYASVVTAPTCTEQGYTTHTCTACGDDYVDGFVESLGHSYEVVETKEPACTEAGCTTYTCHCGDTYTEEISALGHDYVDGVCTHCGEQQVQILLGDVNGDGRVNARDARLLLRYAAGLADETELDLAAADYNGDGRVNARDARAVLRAAAGLD